MSNIKYSILTLVALLFVGVSCSKEMREDGVTTPTASLEARTVRANFTIGEDEDLRLAQRVNDSGVPKTWLEEGQSLKILFLIRVKGEKIKEMAPNVLVCQKIKGRNVVSYVGDVRLPNGAPADATDFEIAGIVVATMNEDETAEQTTIIDTEVSYDGLFGSPLKLVTPDSDGTLDLRMAYVLEWTDIKLINNTFDDVKLTFKPSGNILRFTINNPTTEPITVKSLNIWTNAFLNAHEITFEPDKLVHSHAVVTSGHYPSEKFSSIRETVPLPEETTFAPGDTKRYYMWVVPRRDHSETEYATTIRALGADGEVYKSFYSEKPLKEGTTNVNIKLTPEPKLTPEEVYTSGMVPLRHLAKYNVKSLTELCTKADERTASEYFYASDEQHNTSGVKYTVPNAQPEKLATNINIPGYYLATPEQWTAIMPSHRWYGFNDFDETDRNEQVWLPEETSPRTYQSDYRGVAAQKTIYALRFIGEGNRRLVAIRYRMVGSFTANSTDSRLEIKSRFLGSRFVGTIDDIANEAYWDAVDPTDVTRELPALGWFNSNWNRTTSKLTSLGVEGFYWGLGQRAYEPTSTAQNEQTRKGFISHYYVGFNTALRNAWNTYPATNAYPVRLFMENPLPEDQMP